MTRKDQIEAYLLGRLDEEDQARLEATFFAEDAVFDELEEVEERLIERCLRGDLSAPDREAFEAHYAAAPIRREQIALHDSLRTLAIERRTAGAGGAVPGRSVRPTLPVARIAGVTIAAMLLLTTAVVWKQALPPPANATPAPGTPSPSGPSVVVPTLLLGSGHVRGGIPVPRLVQPLGEGEAVLELVLPSAASGSRYTAELKNADWQTVWHGRAQRRASSAVVPVRVPASVLLSGDYAVILTTEGAAEPVGDYFFQVTPRGRGEDGRPGR